MLEEAATRAVMARAAAGRADTFIPALMAAIASYAAEGFTTVQDGGSTAADMKAIRAHIARSGKPLPVDVVAYPAGTGCSGSAGKRPTIERRYSLSGVSPDEVHGISTGGSGWSSRTAQSWLPQTQPVSMLSTPSPS